MNKEELNNSESVEEVNNTVEEVTTSQPVEETETVVEEVTPVENNIPTEEVTVVEETTPVTEPVVTEEVMPDEKVVVKEASNTTQDGYEFVPKNKGSKGPFVVVAIVIIALTAILYFAYTFISNPKKMFVKSINKGYKEVENFIDDVFEGSEVKKPMLLTDEMSVKLDINDSLLDANSKGLLDEINKLKFKTQIGYDEKNKEMLMAIGALYDNNELVDLGAYVKDEKMYVELKNLFDKYIEVDEEEIKTLFEDTSVVVDKEDLKYILSKTKDAFINNLDEDNFKKSNSTIKVNGKKVKVQKIAYTLSEQKGHELSKKALTELVKDSKYIEAVATISGQDKKELKESMEESLDELTEDVKSGDLSKEELGSFIVYTKGLMGDVVGYEIEIKEEEKSSVAYYKGDKKDEFVFISEGEELINASIAEDKFTLEIIGDDEETVELQVTKKEKGKKTTYSYSITASGASINGDFVIEMLKENKDGSYEANVSLSVDLMGMAEITINGKSKLEYKKGLEMPNVSNSISYDELTETDLNNISMKLLQNQNIQKLVTNINKYISATNSMNTTNTISAY